MKKQLKLGGIGKHNQYRQTDIKYDPLRRLIENRPSNAQINTQYFATEETLANDSEMINSKISILERGDISRISKVSTRMKSLSNHDTQVITKITYIPLNCHLAETNKQEIRQRALSQKYRAVSIQQKKKSKPLTPKTFQNLQRNATQRRIVYVYDCTDKRQYGMVVQTIQDQHNKLQEVVSEYEISKNKNQNQNSKKIRISNGQISGINGNDPNFVSIQRQNKQNNNINLMQIQKKNSDFSSKGTISNNRISNNLTQIEKKSSQTSSKGQKQKGTQGNGTISGIGSKGINESNGGIRSTGSIGSNENNRNIVNISGNGDIKGKKDNETISITGNNGLNGNIGNIRSSQGNGDGKIDSIGGKNIGGNGSIGVSGNKQIGGSGISGTGIVITKKSSGKLKDSPISKVQEEADLTITKDININNSNYLNTPQKKRNQDNINGKNRNEMTSPQNKNFIQHSSKLVSYVPSQTSIQSPTKAGRMNSHLSTLNDRQAKLSEYQQQTGSPGYNFKKYQESSKLSKSKKQPYKYNIYSAFDEQANLKCATGMCMPNQLCASEAKLDNWK